MDAAAAFIVSWLILVGLVYLVNKSAVKYYIAIYWKNEKLVKYIEKFTNIFSFIPIRVYLVIVIMLFIAPLLLVIPLIRPNGQVQFIQGFLFMLIGGTLNALNALMGGAEVGEAAARSAGVTPLVPGITLPWDQLPYIAMAIAVGVVLHELMHGYAALRYGIPVKYVGVFSLFYILSGAFVEPDEEKFKQASTEAKVAVLASGVAINLVLALVAMVLGYLGASWGLQGVVFGISAYGVNQGERVVEIQGCGASERIYTPDDFISKINVMAGLGPLMGVNKSYACKPDDKITLVTASWFERRTVEVDFRNFTTSPRLLWLSQDGSLYLGGLRPGDVVKKIEGCGVSREILWSGQLLATLLELRNICKPGDVVKITAERNGTSQVFNVTLVERNGRIYYGIGQGSLPMWGYDESEITRSEMYNTDFAKLVFWLIVVNYGLAVVNSLPIYPLDGGQLFAAVLQRRFGEQRGVKIVGVISWILAAMLVFNMALGFMGGLYKVLENIR